LKNKHIHIVSFDVPYPADYGGACAVFYKIKALHGKGIKIHLHCFEYGRGKQEALNQYCESVHYYTRTEGAKGFSFTIPYIVASRNNTKLWENLQKDNYPVLLEGIHCTYGIYADLLSSRKVVLYLHNVEFEYYKQLSQWERSLVKKTYYHHESRLLERYEKQIANRCTILSLSEKDKQTYKSKFGAGLIHFLPVFIEQQSVQSITGNGTYALYHGNLSVAENERVAIWLLEKVFNDMDIPFVIAGKNPSERLIKLSHKKNNTCIVSNPSENELKDLIVKAQLHVMPSFTDSGIKLKLINALFNGRHVITNESMVDGTGLEALCHMADNAALTKYQAYRLFQIPFSEEEYNKRKSILLKIFDNDLNADKLIKQLFD
jgi:glycosyltransferase involved in cell wall biosynthesis